MNMCDVLIVGGGLAGLSAARVLKGSGMMVTVLERMSDPVYRRYHTICGEAISDRMFAKAGMEPRAVLRRVGSIVMEFSGKEVEIPVEGSIIDRNELLDSMRAETDADVVRGTVISIRREGDGFIVATSSDEYRCRFLIGADGAHSVVRKDIFGSRPEEMIPIVNNIVEGESDGKLRFIVSERYKGAYRWEFPSAPGMMTVGYTKGTDSVEKYVSRGGRSMPIGRLPAVVSGNCILTGDAASLANPLCFGGIGAALVSGKKAAEAVLSGKPDDYQKWVDRDRMFDPHFMEAHKRFFSWSDDEISKYMDPMVKGYSVFRGFLAILRHPSEANVYFSCWMGFRSGW